MAEEMAEMVSQWALLPTDVLRNIAKRLGNARVDTLRLRSVCKSWRSSIPPFKASFPLTLPFPISPNPSLNPKRRGHFSLNQSTIYFLQPPPSSSSSSAHHHGDGGWLLRVEEPAEAGGNLHPLNPLSKTLTEGVPKAFPKSLNLLNFRISEIGRAYSLRFVDLSKQEIENSFEELKSILVKNVVVSSDGVGTDVAVMAIHGGKLGSFNLGGVRKWSPIDDSKYDDVAYHKGKFYAVDYKGRLVAIGSDSKAKQIVPAGPRVYGGQFKSLVKSGDDLFMVDKYLYPEQAFLYGEDFIHNLDEEDGLDSAVQLKVFKLNEEGKEWEYVQSLDDRVLFIGDDCSFAASAQDFAALKENCIYFSEDTFYHFNEGEKLGEFCVDTGVQCMEDDRCGPLSMFPDHWSIFWPPPAWLKPRPTPTCLSKK